MLLTSSQRTALRRALRLLDIRWARVWFAVILGSLGLGASVALTATSSWLIARASQMPPVMALSVAATGVRLFGVSRSVLRYLERLVSHRVALNGVASLRERLYERLAASSVESVASLRRGDLLVRTGADVDAIGDVVVRSILPALVGLTVGAGTVAFLAWLYPPSGVILALALLVAGIGSPYFSARATRHTEIAMLDQRADLSSEALTMVTGGAELKIWGRLDVVRDRLRQTEEALTELRGQAARPASLAAGIEVFSMGLATLGVIIVGIPALMDGALSPVSLAVIVLTPLAAFEATAPLPAAASQLVRSAGAAERIMAMLDAAEGAERTGTLDADTAPILTASDLSVGWPNGPLVAADMNLVVEPGRAIAIVGSSGIGKTTLLSTLAGLLPPRHGSVTIGDVELSTLKRSNAAQFVSMTAEDAHIFATTVLENLRVARGDLTEDEAEDLLTRAGLGTWLAGLPDGVHTPLDADGANISGGERRRVLIARALASPAPIILVDEPAEHLDPETASTLLSDLLALKNAGRGVVVVTHHISALGGADEVILMEQRADGLAWISDRGMHDDLAARHPSYASAAKEESGAQQAS